jgi:hypothetical protein
MGNVVEVCMDQARYRGSLDPGGPLSLSRLRKTHPSSHIDQPGFS